MKRPLAAIATLVIMGGMLWMGLRHRDRPAAATPPGPPAPIGVDRRYLSDLSGAAERIEALLDGAHRGDVAAYLASFDGPLRGRLEQQANERGRAAFAAELRRAARARQSHAVFVPLADGDGPDSARIIVESIFADRIERQTYCLVHRDAAWLITDVETARDRVPENPLGSLATFHEPEGVPVTREQADADGPAEQD
jgi:hypothetical protein